MDRKQFIADIMVTAAEGGSNYWCRFVRRDYEAMELEIAWQESNCPGVDEDWQRRTITADDIERAVLRIASGQVSVSQHNAGWIRTGSETNDASNIDADAADCVLQVAAMGELVFG